MCRDGPRTGTAHIHFAQGRMTEFPEGHALGPASHPCESFAPRAERNCYTRLRSAVRIGGHIEVTLRSHQNRSVSSAQGPWATASRTSACALEHRSCSTTSRSPQLDRGFAAIETNLGREVAKAKLTAEEAASALARVTATHDRGALTGCSLIIEAANEQFAVKAELFRELDRMIPGGGHSCLEHLFYLNYKARRADETAGAGDRDALLQPGTGDEAGRDCARA